jgi:hypothetical protein
LKPPTRVTIGIISLVWFITVGLLTRAVSKKKRVTKKTCGGLLGRCEVPPHRDNISSQ